MKTFNFKIQTVNFLKYSTFIFILIIFNFKVLNLQLPSVYAQSAISYPVSGLGNCRDAKECSLYCKIPENKAACWSYGKYVLSGNVLGVATMSTEERSATETKVKQHGVTFPIAELGNCAGPEECRNYCGQTANQAACTDFARKKGFAKEEEPKSDGIPEEKRQIIMKMAESELGCTSPESCRMTCEQNQDKCEAFAKKYGIAKEPPKEIQEEQLKKTQMLRVAKEELGCTSMESCKTICQQNPTKCMTFAQKNGYDKRTETPQSDPYPGNQNTFGTGQGTRPPCANDESCKQYCKEHPNECPGYQGKPGLTPAGGALRTMTGSALSSPSAGFVGPTGCRTDEECKTYCQTNPDKCPGFVQSADYKKNMEKFPRVINESSPSSLKRMPLPPEYQIQPITTPTQSRYGEQRPETKSAPSTGNVQYQPVPITPQ